MEVVADLFGVSVRRIQQLTQEGVLPTTDTPDGRRYDLVPTVQKYTAYLSDKAYGRSKTDKEAELKEQKLRAEIARLRRDGVDPELFTLVKNQMYGEMLADVEGVEDAAEAMAAAFLHGYTLAEEVEALAALTVSDANAALQTMLQEDQAAYVEIEPQAAGEEELE